MSEWDLRIAFSRGDRRYRAGEPVSGTVFARLAGSDRGRGVRLRWHWQTHGEGNRDRGETREIVLHEGTMDEGRMYELPFEFTAPSGPFTYHGNLVNVDHYVEATLDLAWAVDPSIEEEFILVPDPMLARLESNALVSTRKVTPKQKGCGPGIGGIVLIVIGANLLPVPGFFLVAIGLLILFWRALAGMKLGKVATRLESAIIAPGEAVEVALGIQPTKAVHINGIEARLKGQETCVSGSGSDKTSHRHEIHAEASSLSGPRTLVGGQLNVIRGTIRVPRTDAYTFSSANNKVTWDLRLHVDVPAWPDWSEEYELTLVPVNPLAFDESGAQVAVEAGVPATPVAMLGGPGGKTRTRALGRTAEKRAAEENREGAAEFAAEQAPESGAASEGGDPAGDPAGDLGRDAAGDLGRDAAGDLAGDLARDRGRDFAGDLAPDLGRDAAGDLAGDAEPHAAPDLAPNAAPDLAPDAMSDAAPAPGPSSAPAPPSPLVTAVQAIVAADRFGSARRPLIDALLGRGFDVAVTVDRVERTFGTQGGPDYRRGRTVRGTLKDSKVQAVVLFPEGRNDEIDALSRGDRIDIRGTAIEWKGLQEHPVLRAEG
jgi:sporulation-control protein spo0M